MPVACEPTTSCMRLFAGYDGRADIWSVGVILYELLTFTRPFQGDNIAQLAMAIARKQPKELPANTPQDLVELTARCLKKDKTTRKERHRQEAAVDRCSLRPSPRGQLRPPQHRAPQWVAGS